MIVEITSSKGDTKEPVFGVLPHQFVPRIGDILFWKNKHYGVKNVLVVYEEDPLRLGIIKIFVRDIDASHLIEVMNFNIE